MRVVTVDELYQQLDDDASAESAAKEEAQARAKFAELQARFGTSST